jgi:PST family polysaccharide transporter
MLIRFLPSGRLWQGHNSFLNVSATHNEVEQPAAAVGIGRPQPLEEVATQAARPSSYRQILKSSALIGGTSALNIAIGIVRTKAMALILGPSGFGLMGMYVSLTSMVGSFTILGMNSSGVRQIAEAAGSGDKSRIARTITALRRVMLISGCTGTLLLFLLRKTASQVVFGDTKHAASIGLLSLTVLFFSVTGGQKALIQGLRRLKELASISILGSLFGTFVSIPLVLWLGERGVAPSLLAIAAFGTIPSWWYARKVKTGRVRMAWRETFAEARGMLTLGLAFLASSLLGALVGFLTRIIILHRLGLSSAGVYQAVITISGTYVGIILQAILADFYPRLTAVAKDNTECNRLVNEQIEISLLLAIPGILATIALAPLVMNVFYSSQFVEATAVLRWQTLGVFLRLISWPLLLIILAKNCSKWFLFTEILNTLSQIALFWLCVRFLGFLGAGVGFFLAFLLYLGLMVVMGRRLSGFSFSAANLRIGALAVMAVALTFVCCQSLPALWGGLVGTGAAIGAGLWSVSVFFALLAKSHTTAPLARIPILGAISNKMFRRALSKGIK